MLEQLKVVLLSQRPELKISADEKFRDCWNHFMLSSEVSTKYREYRDKEFPEYHFFVIDRNENVLALCKSIPTFWDGNNDHLPAGYDDALEYSVMYYQNNGKGNWNTLIGTSVTVFKDYRNLGLSGFCIQAMKTLCSNNGFGNLIIPVRPTLKHRYPLTDIDEYIRWSDSNGLPFDPWIRTHISSGGKIARTARNSMTIKANLNDWEKWTNMKFPATGKYIIDGALMPLEIDFENKSGTYLEPNVWIVYSI